MSPKSNIFSIRREFYILNPKSTLSWLCLTKFCFSFIKEIELTIKQMYFSFEISNNYQLSWTLFPIYSSDLLFHLKNMCLWVCFLIIYSYCFIISSCYKPCLIRRPALCPELTFIMACHYRLNRRIFLCKWKLVNWWRICTHQYLIFEKIYRKYSWIYCIYFRHLKYNTIAN